jgi:hypothetical protein
MSTIAHLLHGRDIWVLGSGPSLDRIEGERMACAMVPNSVIKYIQPPGDIIWCALDVSEMRRHTIMPTCDAALLSHHAYEEAGRLGWLDKNKTDRVSRSGPIPIGPGTVSMMAGACAYHGARSVRFAGFGGDGFAACLGEPYSTRPWRALEQSAFPKQIDAAKKILDRAAIPWELF